MTHQLLEGNWYHIPGYNGYVINIDGVVKSMKHFNARPEGMYLQKHKDRFGDYYYELTDIKNKREKVPVYHLMSLVKHGDTLHVLGDNEVYMGSRNRGYMNYQKKFPNDKGIMKVQIPGQPSVVSNIEPSSTPDVKLNFSSFNNFNKKEPEPMVRFY